MSSVATNQESAARLSELEGAVRDAWERYYEEVRHLDGPAYGIAEPAAWENLQLTLGEVESERGELAR